MDHDLIRYESTLSERQLVEAAQPIDETRSKKTSPPRIARLKSAPFKVCAISNDGHVVGVAAIKSIIHRAGEAGFLVVRNDYRRRGIARRLFRVRRSFAVDAGLDMLYANCVKSNAVSRKLLLDSGYCHFCDRVSPYGSGKTLSWFYLALTLGADPKSILPDILDSDRCSSFRLT